MLIETVVVAPPKLYVTVERKVRAPKSVVVANGNRFRRDAELGKVPQKPCLSDVKVGVRMKSP